MGFIIVNWLFFSLANHHRGRRFPKILLAKTTESFKLADLQTMEGHIHANQDGRYTCERILLDQATGSSILSLQLTMEHKSNNNNNDNNDDMDVHEFVQSSTLPTSLQRCDWIGLVYAHNNNANDFLNEVESMGSSLVDSSWSLDYLRFQDQKQAVSRTPTTTYTGRSLLCCVAQRIRAPNTALNPQDAQEKLVILDLDLKGLFLVKVLNRQSVAQRDSEIQKKWSVRPYKYSSAISFAIAEIVIDLLRSLLHITKGGRPVLLDPTCGSGKPKWKIRSVNCLSKCK